jgi:tripartite-type tricarboxylate transporter receptor subunit TctC
MAKDFRMHATLRLCCSIISAALLIRPADAADFYAGKTIELTVGADAGGGYDIYARTLARHMGRYIPGHPSIIVRNMPGAGSGRAAGYISTLAPKDGTSLAAIMPGAIMDPLLADRGAALFDPTKVRYVGTASNDTRVCLTMKASPTKTFDDALVRQTTIGAISSNDSTRDYAFMHKHLSGAKLDIVTGYQGTVEIGLALERGEIEGACGWGWSSIKAQKPDWIRDRKINVLVQVGLEPNAELNGMGVPPIWNYLTSEADRKAVELIVSQQVMIRSYIAPPETPPEQIGILRTAFDATMTDRQFLDEAETQRLVVDPMTGAKVQELVQTLYATPADIVERARHAINP